MFPRVMSDSGEKVKKTSRIDASTEACFLKCGITNNLDGSEDELVYNSTENTQASKTYLNQTLSQNLKVSLFRNVLFKDTEHFT